MKVRIAEIVVRERRRDDLGDIPKMARSLARYGMIEPIIIDDTYTLVAGQRRLEAAKLLGWSRIEARNLGELSDEERDELKLVENVDRKPLTAAEKSKRWVYQAAKAAEVLQQRAEAPSAAEPSPVDSPLSPGALPPEFSGTSPEKAKRGRPEDPVSEEKVAEFLGTSAREIGRAADHVAAIERYPILGGPDVSQNQAMDLSKCLDSLPTGEGTILLDVLQAMGLPWKKLAGAIERVTGWSTPQRQRLYQLASAETQRERSLAITLTSDSGPSPDPQLLRIQSMRGFLKQARSQADWCTKEYPDDPWAAQLEAVKTDLQTMTGTLLLIEQAMQEASRRAYDAALETEESVVAADSGRGQGLTEL
jgi:hypothetical protein